MGCCVHSLFKQNSQLCCRKSCCNGKTWIYCNYLVFVAYNPYTWKCLRRLNWLCKRFVRDINEKNEMKTNDRTQSIDRMAENMHKDTNTTRTECAKWRWNKTESKNISRHVLGNDKVCNHFAMPIGANRKEKLIKLSLQYWNRMRKHK